jgi:hypothetical protein
MQDHLEMLINELKSYQLIIKILQEEVDSLSASLRNQNNLTNCAEKNPHNELHHTDRRNHTWKEIHHTRTAIKKHKRQGLICLQIKQEQTQSHLNQIAMTYCVVIQKVTIPHFIH